MADVPSCRFAAVDFVRMAVTRCAGGGIVEAVLRGFPSPIGARGAMTFSLERELVGVLEAGTWRFAFAGAAWLQRRSFAESDFYLVA